MNRKNFLSSIIPLALMPAATAGISNGIQQLPEDNDQVIIPPYLGKGDTIGIMCPAGYITLDDIQPAVNKLREWGYEVKIGNTVGKKEFSMAGTDEERLADIQQMLDDKNIKAILFGRGGYGIVRIIDRINFTKFVTSPKWLIGFSDITVMLNHIIRQFNIAGIHSKMCNSFPSNWDTAEPVQIDSINSIRQCLNGTKMTYTAPVNAANRNGIASGQLIGGNLKTIETLAGTASSINTKNKILFVEDTGEYLYSIDRMFWNLKRTNKLSALKGLVIGGFKIKPDDPGEEFGRSLVDIVLEKVKDHRFPVCFDFPVGHQKNNYALRCGVVHKLTVSSNGTRLEQL